jgi:hypothetical protein
MDGEGLGMPMGKRLGPDDVPPVIIGDTRFEVVHWGRERGLEQNGGYIAAYDVQSGSELWMLKVYHVEYDEKMESDVQDVFIESMVEDAASGNLNIADERGKEYVVNIAKQTITCL